MFEEEWLASIPSLMMQHIAQAAPASPRKLRLLAAAYARHLQSLPDYAGAKHVAHLGEEVAEGLTAQRTLLDGPVWAYEGDWRIANVALVPDDQLDMAVRKAVYFAEDGSGRPSFARALILCVLGNPFRPLTLNPSFITPTVLSLANAAYLERDLPSGLLQTPRLLVLADALEEAGCDAAELLLHFRSAGPHVRGCAALDTVLGRG